MKTPFTQEQFFSVFEQYNHAIFPGQIFIFLLGVLSIILLFTKRPSKDILIGSIIGMLWIWIGAVYHIAFFAAINPVARVFGGIFILQGLLVLYNTFKNKFRVAINDTTGDYIGYFLILFGMIIYPVIGYFINGETSKIISLGLPCPTTIFTLGFFILAKNQLPKYLLIIPILWAFIGTSAAVNFGVYQDFMLVISAIAVLGIFFMKNKMVIEVEKSLY